jgi:hypothetical protein
MGVFTGFRRLLQPDEAISQQVFEEAGKLFLL